MPNFILLMAQTAAGGAASSPTSMLGAILPILLVFVVFYFFLIRPEKKKNKQVTDMRDSLRVGDEIVTIGGIVGKVTNIKDDQLTLETGADRQKIRLMRWAIGSKVEKDEPEAPASETKELDE